MQKTHTHGQWTSRMGFVLAATGSAVGLGNIWKFPYMIGQSGGAAFVLVYLLCIALIGLPILVAEWMIGRRGQKNPISTMGELAKKNGRSGAWALIGFTGVLGAFLILSFYSVIGGWALSYTGDAITGGFTGMDKDAVGNAFTGFLANAGSLLTWHTVFMALTVGVVAMGVAGGLERASKLLMPSLGVLLFILVGYGMTTGGFGQAMAYLFNPDWSKLTGDVVLAALGHAFFTLSLGMGIMMAYGSYLGEDVDLLRTARTVVIMDTVIAIAAGLAIFPIVFANGLDPAAGPGLIFVTLPIAFGNITGGVILGTLFFVLLTFAALTSAISLLEPVVELVEERTPLSRAGATFVAGIATWALGIAALLSFNHWSDVTIIGLNIFDLLDQLTSKFMLPLTGLGAILFAAWCLDRDSVRKELGLGELGFSVWNVVARFVAPVGVLIVFVSNL
ncbi:sodium-dependent transporter [Thauera mechernichensis]|uniref:Transporter n=1 Tax=Thauera mechernichensis TaxID=82788 RepID=A0ABW3WC88_9RHOO|nr:MULTISPECIES: sodium-dependent transporter [Thauera]ENO79633.1 sodium:neurotransmitter symporter [Thauera sp. 27]MDG3065555.1 sodium-dependent transporter [Thauera mechernichensis]WBL65079.1 sodium-dependent transporter [Thauera sp. WB-2]HAG76171.1 sodium-dependent transporter [Thauera sp.]HAY08904.1 sodium-dependent transporter [Thauera sp.]